MAYNPPPHYSFGESHPQQPQQPQSVPPGYSPQPQQQPVEAGYLPQQPGPISAQPGMPSQPGFAPQPLLQPPPTGPRRSPVVPVLAVAMVIGLAGAVLGMVMWLGSSGDLDDAETRIGDRDAQIAQLEEDLEAAQAQAAELETAEAAAAEAESMRACLDDLKWYYSTAADSAEETEAQDAVTDSCQDWIW